jgi:hypothetical protein
VAAAAAAVAGDAGGPVVVGGRLRLVAMRTISSVGPGSAATAKLDAARGNPVRCLAAATFVA